LEGVPGLGKTMLVRTLAQAVDCAFSRIQFTPISCRLIRWYQHHRGRRQRGAPFSV